MGPTNDVLRLNRAGFTAAHGDGTHPVLLPNGLEGWPAVSRWTPQTLSVRFPHRLVPLKISETGGFRYNPDASMIEAADELPSVPFGVALDRIMNDTESGLKYYVAQLDISSTLPELLDDLIFPVPVTNGAVKLWVGSGGTVSALHFDSVNSLYAQVYGAEDFLLFAPEDTPYLYTHPSDCEAFYFSYVNCSAPDLRRHPLYTKAQPIRVRVNAGDLLFLPAFWWHQVHALSISISANLWWPPRLTQCCGPNALARLSYAYQTDRWAKFRAHLGDVSPSTLLESAVAVLSRNPRLAALAAGAALAAWEPAASIAGDLLAMKERCEAIALKIAGDGDSRGPECSGEGVQEVIRMVQRLVTDS